MAVIKKFKIKSYKNIQSIIELKIYPFFIIKDNYRKLKFEYLQTEI